MLGFGFAAGMTAAQKAIRIMGFALIVIALLTLSYCQGRTDGKNAANIGIEKAKVEHYKKGLAAGEKAAEARLADERRQLEVEKDYEEAIASAPGGRNSPAAVALACRRLVQSGYSGAELPAECRS